jgi:hypothetical protein
MEFDEKITGVLFGLLIAVGAGGLIGSPIPMDTNTILMMVAPSMAVFGLIMLVIGVKHGEYRATK